MKFNVMLKLIQLFEQEFHRNYLWIEDVFLTGKQIISAIFGNLSFILIFTVYTIFREITIFKLEIRYYFKFLWHSDMYEGRSRSFAHTILE